MQYYKDNNGAYYVFDDLERHIDGSYIRISEAEYLQSLEPPKPTKEQRIARVISEINAERDARLLNLIVEYNGARYDADEKSQLRMTAALALLSAAPPGTTQSWIDADNAARELSASDFAAIGAIIAQEVTRIMLAARERKDAAIAAIEASDE
ncbi:MAG: DUF4376 domain-containing protein [Helicobacteraceae bacterium]|jgi:hypothetical protein|nr:DUF4376 domain-containing protein [Helicobacteraceae bacterium]